MQPTAKVLTIVVGRGGSDLRVRATSAIFNFTNEGRAKWPRTYWKAQGWGIILGASSDDGMRKICVLDDNLSVLKATGRLLSSAGWEVEVFSDPKTFLGYAESEKPPVVVLDMRMTPLDGLEVQRQLRAVSPATRVIVFSSDDDPLVRSRAMDAGASAYFLKPGADHELLAAVDAAARGR